MKKALRIFGIGLGAAVAIMVFVSVAVIIALLIPMPLGGIALMGWIGFCLFGFAAWVAEKS